MKSIYDAVRDLLYPEHAENRAGPAVSLREYPWEIRFSLLDFERRNRGHRNQLSSAELSPFAQLLRGTPEYTRRESLSETSHALFMFLMQAPLRRLPNSPAVSAVLKARDNLGWLRHHTGQLLEHRCQEVLRELALPDYDMYYGRIEDAGSCYVLHLSVTLRGRELQARRKFELPTGDCSTLAGAHAFITSTTTCIRDILGAIPLWPEFGAALKEQADLRNIRDDFARVIQQYSPEMRELLATRWSDVCPVPRPNRT
jgi:hypothetical protein